MTDSARVLNDGENQPISDNLAFRPIMPDREPSPLDVHVSHLPPEILTIIFRHLKVVDRCRVAGVCAGWRCIAYQRSLWRDTKVSIDYRSVYYLNLILNYKPAFESLTIRNIVNLKVKTFDQDVLNTVVQYMPNLTGLILDCYSGAELPSSLLSRMPNLTQLDLSKALRVDDRTVKLISLHLKKIVQICLGNCSGLTDISLLHIAQGLPALKWLDLDCCQRLSDRGIGYLCGRDVGNPAGIPALESVRLTNLKNITDQSLRFLSEGQASLLELNIRWQVYFTEVGLAHLAKMEKLSKLSLFGYCMNYVSLASLANGGSKVTSLDITQCQLREEELNQLGRMTHLLELDLTRSVFHDGMEQLIKCGSKLRILNLSYCIDVTDWDMYHVARLQDLRELNLDCTDVGDEGLSYLVAADSQVAILYGNGWMTDVGLRHLAKLTNLRQLTMVTSKITCDGLADFVAETGQRMTDLNLKHCWGLNEGTLLCVARGLFRLETLVLNPHHLNDEGKVEAVRNLPRLRQLRVNNVDIIEKLRNFVRDHVP